MRKVDSNKINNTVFGFTCFQIVIVSLQLIVAFFDIPSSMPIFSFFVFLFLGPLFIISVFIELIVLIVAKFSQKHNSIKNQDDAAMAFYIENVNNPGITIQSTRPKKMKRSTISLIVLASMIGATILLIVGNVFLTRYFSISNAFSREQSMLENSLYDVKLLKKDINEGIMTVRLDDDIVIDYSCSVAPFGIDSGYGPFCGYKPADGSNSLGEFIFRKNYYEIKRLLNKYKDTLAVDNADYIFKVYDQEKMQLFFSELMQIADYNKAYSVYLNSDDLKFMNQLDYIYIGGVEYEGRNYDGINLFKWAEYEGFKP